MIISGTVGAPVTDCGPINRGHGHLDVGISLSGVDLDLDSSYVQMTSFRHGAPCLTPKLPRVPAYPVHCFAFPQGICTHEDSEDSNLHLLLLLLQVQANNEGSVEIEGVNLL